MFWTMRVTSRRVMLSRFALIIWRGYGRKSLKTRWTWEFCSEYWIGYQSNFKLLSRLYRGGFVNRLYVCENQKVTSGSQEVKHVILRLYGGKMVDKSENAFKAYGEVGEVLVYYIMAQEGLGPQIYGVFSGGRVEQYLPVSRTHSLCFLDENYNLFSVKNHIEWWPVGSCCHISFCSKIGSNPFFECSILQRTERYVFHATQSSSVDTAPIQRRIKAAASPKRERRGSSVGTKFQPVTSPGVCNKNTATR